MNLKFGILFRLVIFISSVVRGFSIQRKRNEGFIGDPSTSTHHSSGEQRVNIRHNKHNTTANEVHSSIEEIPTGGQNHTGKKNSVSPLLGLLHLYSFLPSLTSLSKLHLASYERILDKQQSSDILNQQSSETMKTKSTYTRRRRRTTQEITTMYILAPANSNLHSISFRVDIQNRLENVFQTDSTQSQTADKTTINIPALIEVNGSATHLNDVQGMGNITNLTATTYTELELDTTSTAVIPIIEFENNTTEDTELQSTNTENTTTVTTTTHTTVSTTSISTGSTGTTSAELLREGTPSTMDTDNISLSNQEAATNPALTHMRNTSNSYNHTEQKDVHKCGKESQYEVMIVSIKEESAPNIRRKRQTSRPIEIQFAVLREGRVVDAQEVANKLSAMNDINNKFGYQITGVRVGGANADLSSPLVVEALEPCCVASIILGSVLGVLVVAFVAYFVYEGEMNKKERKKAAGREEQNRISIKLATEKDRLLKENGELKRKIRLLDIGTISTTHKDQVSRRESFSSHADPSIAQSKTFREQSPYRPAQTNQSKLTQHLLGSRPPPVVRHSIHDPQDQQDLARRFTEAGQVYDQDSEMMEKVRSTSLAHPVCQSTTMHTAKTVPASLDNLSGRFGSFRPRLASFSRSVAPPPGTGKPGQMITELDGRKMSNLKSEAGLASPDTFRPMTNPPNTNKQHYAKQRTFPRWTDRSLPRDFGRKKVSLDIARSKSSQSVNKRTPSEPATTSRSTALTVDKATNTDKLDLTQRGAIDSMFSTAPHRAHSDTNMNSAKQKSSTKSTDKKETVPTADINLIKLLLNAPKVSAMTQTEQGKHDEKLIAHYQNIIKSLQKQLETEQHERREIEKKSLKRAARADRMSCSDGTAPPKPPPKQSETRLTRGSQAEAKHPPSTSHSGPRRFENGDPSNSKPPAEERFAKATKHFLEEIGPVLSDMGYKIVDVDGRGATTRRKESLRRFHSKPSVEEYKQSLTDLYGAPDRPRPEVVKMFEIRLSVPTIARVHSLTEEKVADLLIDAYMRTAELDANHLMKDLNINMEQVIAVRNYLRNHRSKGKEDVIKNLPANLQITDQTVKLSIALLQHKFI